MLDTKLTNLYGSFPCIADYFFIHSEWSSCMVLFPLAELANINICALSWQTYIGFFLGIELAFLYDYFFAHRNVQVVSFFPFWIS